jgi:hypothetical protein
MNSKKVHDKMCDYRNYAIRRCNSIINKTMRRRSILDDIRVNIAIHIRPINVNVMRDLLNEIKK